MVFVLEFFLIAKQLDLRINMIRKKRESFLFPMRYVLHQNTFLIYNVSCTLDMLVWSVDLWISSDFVLKNKLILNSKKISQNLLKIECALQELLQNTDSYLIFDSLANHSNSFPKGVENSSKTYEISNVRVNCLLSQGGLWVWSFLILVLLNGY